MSPSVFLVGPTVSLLLGQVGADRLEVHVVFGGAVALTVIALLLGARCLRFGLLVVLCVAAYLWGYIAYERLLHPSLPEHHIARLPDSPERVSVEARLYREPEQRGNKTRWFLRVERLEQGNVAVPASGNVVVTVARAYREWRYGDLLRLPLRLRIPKNRASFDYVAYLARREIYRTAYLHNDWQVELVSRDPTTAWFWIEWMRRDIRRFIYRYLSPPAAPLLEALILGDRGRLSPELSRSFTEVGMAHVLSISGLHVGMLSVWVFFFFRYFLSRSTFLLLRWPMFKFAALACTAPVLLYTGLAGGRIPTVRAAIMIGVYQLAVLLDRDEETLTSLVLAALIAAVVWPGAIMEPSFQLSFLAVLAIVWGLRILRHREPSEARAAVRSAWLRVSWNGLLIGVIVPILATVGTGPLIVYHFGYLSLSGLLANPLLVPFVGFVLVPLGLFTGLVSLLSSSLAVWLAWAIEPLLSFLAFVVGCFAGLPMSSVHLPKPDGWVIVCVYLVLLGVACFATSLNPTRYIRK